MRDILKAAGVGSQYISIYAADVIIGKHPRQELSLLKVESIIPNLVHLGSEC